jgi:CheY-like chemotaxis protein
MPEEDGYSLLRRIRALPPEHGGDVPAIALTAYARPEDVRAATDAGFQLHVVKPIKPEALVEAISAWVTPG